MHRESRPKGVDESLRGLVGISGDCRTAFGSWAVVENESAGHKTK